MNDFVDSALDTPIFKKQWLSLEQAIRKVAKFGHEFGKAHLSLACHAALPSILTPELVNLIRINFLEKSVEWIAESDLLLSSLCLPINQGVFEVEPQIRQVLLVALQADPEWGSERLEEIAYLLYSYNESPLSNKVATHIKRIYQWISSAYLDPDTTVQAMFDFLRNTELEAPASRVANYRLVGRTLAMLANPLETTNLQVELEDLADSAYLVLQGYEGKENIFELLQDNFNDTDETTQFLTNSVKNWLISFGIATDNDINSMPAQFRIQNTEDDSKTRATPINILVYYSRTDIKLRSELEEYLRRPLEQERVISWHDCLVSLDVDWKQDITLYLNSAQIILLLVSPDFLASDFCYGVEMQRVLERHQAGNLRVIPILFRPTDWRSAPFGQLKALPSNEEPITTWQNRSTAFEDVTREVRQAIAEIQQARKEPDAIHSSPLADVLLVTATGLEARAVMLAFNETCGHAHITHQIRGNEYWELGEIGGKHVFLTMLEMGAINATITILNALNDLLPSLIIMVGFAFGMDKKKQRIGDILVSTQLASYDFEKESVNNNNTQSVVLSGDSMKIPTWLLDIFRKGSSDWQGPPVTFGPIFSSERLLIDNQIFLNQLRTIVPDAIGGDTEDAALYTAMQNKQVDWIIVKAICDWVDDKKSQQKLKNQLLAANKAVSFIIHVLQQSGFVSQEAEDQDNVQENLSAPFWNVPHPRNHFFTGYDEVLAEIHDQLYADRSVGLAISGLEGIGKTQIVLEYAYRYRQEYQAVVWIRADSQGALISSYMEFATMLAPTEWNDQDPSAVVKAVIQWFQENEGWLLIIDNANELDAVEPFLPRAGSGHLLLTTRAYAGHKLALRIVLNTLPPEQGALLLLRRANLLVLNAPFEQTPVNGQNLAMQISQELGGLPLALDQAGAYIEENGIDLSVYLQLYRQRRKQLLKLRGRHIADHPESVATTWSLTFTKMEQSNPAAADLLRLCAFLAPDNIPEEIIILGAPHLGPLLAPIATNTLVLDQTVRTLLAYSQLHRYVDSAMLSIHRLVQTILLDSMSQNMIKEWSERAIRAVNEAFPEVEFAQWAECERCLPHALMCATWIEKEQMTFPEATHLLRKAGFYLNERMQYAQAELLTRQALAIQERPLRRDEPSEHPDILNTANDLALICERQGKYAEAERLLTHVLASHERLLGAEHSATATSLNNLAHLYRNQGKYKEAEPLFQRALAIRERVLGPEHSDTATSLSNLALLYEYQDKYEEAELLFQRSLAIQERTLGFEHPDTATSLNNLAYLYRNQGKYEEAESLFQRALATRERILGPEHPDTALSFSNLALLYENLGKYEEAEPLSQRALAIRQRVLGPEHPSTATSLNNLAHLYWNQGKYEEAELLFQRALAIRERALGPEHPDTATSLSNLALLYEYQGKYEEAELLFQRALAIQKHILGPEHHVTINTLQSLRSLYQKQGKSIENENFRQQDQNQEGEILKAGQFRPILEQALHEAKEEVIILSPQVNRSACDDNLCHLIGEAIKRGVHISIGYSAYSGQNILGEVPKSVLEVRDALNFHVPNSLKHFLEMKAINHLHSKTLVCDRIFVATGNFNWLSDLDQQNRSETGIMIHSRDQVMKIANDALQLLSSPNETDTLPKEDLYDIPPLVKVSHDDFEQFLHQQPNEYWDIDKQSIQEFIHGRPFTTEDLMRAIEVNDDGSGYVYVFSDEDPFEVVNTIDLNSIPIIKKEDLKDYIIMSDGKDFLYFDCNLDEASNGNPAVLVPAKAHGGPVAVSYEDFENFLRDQKYTYWSVDKPAIEQFMSGYGTVDELMQAIRICGNDNDWIYIFNEEDNLEEIAKGTNWDAIPKIHKEDLSHYIVTQKSNGGEDFLYFDCTPDEASNGNPAILFPYEEKEEEADMSSIFDKYYGLVSVSYYEFESFLNEQENKFWYVYKSSIEEFSGASLLTVEEIIEIIYKYDEGANLIYVFRPDRLPEEITRATSWKAIPKIGKKDLYDYIIRSASGGKDFLWFDCDISDASNGEPAVLIPEYNSDAQSHNLTIIDLSIAAAHQIGADQHSVSLSDLHAAYLRTNPGIGKGITQESFGATVNYYTINMKSRFPNPNNKQESASWLSRPVFKRITRGQYMLLSSDELRLFHQRFEEGDPRIYQDEYDIDDLL